MSYIQIIEIETEEYDQLERAHESWLAATEGERTVVQEWICKDRDRPNTYLMIVEFPSAEAAGANNDLPATGEIAAALSALAESPLNFLNLDVLRHD
jgi:quinol monooxygenase YgiN